MMKFFLFAIAAVVLISCKSKKKADPNAHYFPVVSYLKGQVAQMDSSLASIIKIEKVDSIPDTVYIKREDFKNYAKEFLELPDISSEKLKDDYDVKSMYDDVMKVSILTYETTEPKNEIKKEDVIIQPDEQGNTNVKTINIDKWTSKGDSTVHKNMVWQVGKSFLIVTKVDKPGQTEKVRTLEVKWNL